MRKPIAAHGSFVVLLNENVMQRAWHLWWGTAVWLLLAAFATERLSAQALAIPFTRYALPNGLTLIVHEDRKAPVVGVTIWYRVGSGNERLGRRGFAHLFEHLMYSGSEHAPERFLTMVDRVGATNRSGATGPDHTYYFERRARQLLVDLRSK